MFTRRAGSVALAALLGLVVWLTGPALRRVQQPAFAGISNEIIDLLPGAYQVSYFDVSSSFTKSQQGYGGPGHSGGDGDALVHIIDVGNYETLVPGDASPASATTFEPGSLCANIYVFDDDQEMQECCSCPLTADSVQTFSVINNLTSNPQFSSPLGVGVIKIVASRLTQIAAVASAPNSLLPLSECVSGGNGALGRAGTLTPEDLADGLTAWINHTESVASNNLGFTPPFGFVISTSVADFAFAPLDSGELTNLTTECSNIELHASGRGICSCGIGS